MSSLVSELAIQKFDVTLPVSKKKIEYRAFLVKEEKMLMLAAETKNEDDIYTAMRDIVSACTFGKVEPENIPIVDLEYLFLKIRSRSVGETASPGLKCEKCNKFTETKIDLSKIEPVMNENHKSKFSITDNIIVEMAYPKFTDLQRIRKHEKDIDKAIDLVVSCVSKIHTKTQTFNTKEHEREEIEEFVSHFTTEQFKMLTDFLETMPKLKTNIEFKCSHCKHETKINLEGIQDFF